LVLDHGSELIDRVVDLGGILLADPGDRRLLCLRHIQVSEAFHRISRGILCGCRGGRVVACELPASDMTNITAKHMVVLIMHSLLSWPRPAVGAVSPPPAGEVDAGIPWFVIAVSRR